MQCVLQKSSEIVFRVDEASEPTDEELMSLLRVEDPKALDLLFSRYSRLVYGIAFRILRNSGEAEEVVQECFLYIFRKPLSFEPSKGSARVWIVQVAYSRARDRKAQLLRQGFYVRGNYDPGEMDTILANQNDLEREIGARLDLDRLRQAFNDLSVVQRRTIQLFYFEDMELREISEYLHEPLGNVRHHFYRGLERLRKSAIAERLRNYHDVKE